MNFRHAFPLAEFVVSHMVSGANLKLDFAKSFFSLAYILKNSSNFAYILQLLNHKACIVVDK